MSEVSQSTPKGTNVRTNGGLRLAGGVLRALNAVSPRLASRVASELFLSPRRASRPAGERGWFESARKETVLVSGLRIVTSSWGEGSSTVLLIHGWEGRGSQLGAFAERFASEGFRVIAPDFPAHGASSGRRSNLIEFAAITGALIDEHRPAAIVAHSFGAAATSVALSERPMAPRLVYVAPPENFDYFTSQFAGMLGVPMTLARRMQSDLERRFAIDWERMRGIALAPRMRAPLLVIHDEEDRDVPSHFGRELAAAWPGAELVLTRGLGHRRILRDPTVIDRAARFVGR